MDENKPIKVCFASTGYGPLWAPAVTSWLRVMGITARHLEVNQLGKIAGAGVTDRTYTHSAENQLVKDFLAVEDATHLFLTESDMILPDNAITGLLETDKDMVSGLYFLRSTSWDHRGQPCLYKRPNAVRAGEEESYGQTPVSIFPTQEPFQVDCAGVGCVLIKRHVFEGLPWPWFDLKESHYGSDMYFYKHARDAGFELWCNPKVRCGQIDYYQMEFADWVWRLENDKDFGKYGFIIGQAP